jgi:hypothetical protein
VGQAVGAGDDDGATNYGWQTLRIALATQLLIAVVLVAAARPVAVAFGTEYVDLTVTFIRVFGLAVAGFSVSRTMRGSLRGAGDTRWPLYGTVLGSFVVRLPVAALALPAGFAVTARGPLDRLLEHALVEDRRERPRTLLLTIDSEPPLLPFQPHPFHSILLDRPIDLVRTRTRRTLGVLPGHRYPSRYRCL